MNAMMERGEKLNTLHDKVASMGDDAEDFYQMARQLRQKAEKQASWLPF